MKTYSYKGKCILFIGIFFIFFPVFLNAFPLYPQHGVSGTITDSDGLPLPGVNVVVKGTQSGTISGIKGTYVLEAEVTDTLVFSYIGFKREEVVVGDRAVIDVVLQEDVTALEGVEVNAGYYTVKEKEKTGSISRITAETIEKQPVSNPLAAMQGRMAGVSIRQSTGVPGGSFSVEIRGRNSLRNDGNAPLYIIDGVPYTVGSLSLTGGLIVPGANPLVGINPGDIRSIEILKDADATAIYGSRGANGVVLITTKKGKPGKVSVKLDIYSGVGSIPRKMDMLSTEQYLEMRHEALANDGATPSEFDPDINGAWDQDRYTDWQEVLLGGTAFTTNAQFSVSGGTPQTQFLFRGGYYRETTVFPGDFALGRGSGLFNLTHTSKDQKFDVALSANYTVTQNNLLREDLTDEALSLPPNAPPIYDEAGELNWANSTWSNPFALLRRKYENNTKNLVTHLDLGYEIARGLRLKAGLGYTATHTRDMSTVPVASWNPLFIQYGTTGSAAFGNQEFTSWIAEPQLTYECSLGQNGRLKLLAGATFQQTRSEGTVLAASGYTSDALLEDPRAAPDIAIQNTFFNDYRYMAVFGRIHYSFKDKYFLNLTGRRDGSSRFGPGRRFGNFGAIGAAWLFSEESYLRDRWGFLSFGKLRASYGVTGSDAIGDYGFLDSYVSTTYPYGGGSGLRPARLFNPDFSWETNKKLEIALEAGFFNNRIRMEAAYYRNRSSNQLVGFPLAHTTGFTSVQANLPATVENTGWEFLLQSTNINTPHFNWKTSANLTLPRNRLVAYPGIENSPYANTYIIGEPLFIRRSFHVTGVDPDTGLYTFEDVNGDGNISFPEDLKTAPRTGRTYFGGINNSLTLKNWQLDVFTEFVHQRRESFFGNVSAPGTLRNQPAIVMERWQRPGDQTDIQRFTRGGEGLTAYTNFRTRGDASLADASFIRLKNVSLSYRFSGQRLKGTGLTGLRLYLQGQNLATLVTGDKALIGMDPESGLSRLPPLRVITAGIQLIF
ncbi:SusC/RagA family TonB-linked outer membrane protein [Sinomicrobium kalidii]|uniref:SusC/RagA family TonB-linked outer membrane protein n=1 Tax=Sinomicrobium kalidii TaxID=2900738 RepID=UPI001E35030A|nr:SusC/RagA family TonB-linked outer membrane protein [Sinomicrobium kalidii]UGU15396.1 SusC/RagA family TonB-linked outer membrane protein [Sinomicrobium kalidii]